MESHLLSAFQEKDQLAHCIAISNYILSIACNFLLATNAALELPKMKAWTSGMNDVCFSFNVKTKVFQLMQTNY